MRVALGVAVRIGHRRGDAEARRRADTRFVQPVPRFARPHEGLVVEARGNEAAQKGVVDRSEEHTSELQSLMRISYAVFCLKKKNQKIKILTVRNYYNIQPDIIQTHLQ